MIDPVLAAIEPAATLPAVFLPSIVRQAIRSFVSIYSFMILVWALFSWFDHSRGWLRDFYNVLDTLVGPYVAVFRSFVPLIGNIDISPIIAMLALQLLVWLL